MTEVGFAQAADARLVGINARDLSTFNLGVPQELVKSMSPRLQRLLGYDIWPPFMGHVTASHPLKTLEAGYVPPVLVDRVVEE